MISAMLCLTVAAVGIDAGWKPLPEGGMVYTIQLEPEARALLRSGQVFESDVPANVNVRTFRIMVGKERLPQIPPASSITETQKPALGPPMLFNPSAPQSGSYSGKRKNRESVDSPPDGTRNAPATVNEKPSSPSPAPSAPAEAKTSTEPSKPWLPLTVAWLAFIGSSAAFVYLLWIHLELRSRYRKLLQSSLTVQ
jgi:hypothetical protein